ncbi:hypothetical protein MXD63_46505, partial [Frankia sp. Cpl3]|nr:hypothetical protein [Frankia sp. Cpl3]
EVVFAEQINVAAGDPVACLLTRNFEAIHNFEGVVLAREDHRLILFHSPTLIEFREQRRRYPRFDTDVKGWIRQLITE